MGLTVEVPLESTAVGNQMCIRDSNDIPALDTAELEAVDLPEGAVLNGSDMPKPSDYLSARQKNGVPLGADDIYRETWLWLKQRNCENLVNKRLIEAYAQAYACLLYTSTATRLDRLFLMKRQSAHRRLMMLNSLPSGTAHRNSTVR